MASPLLSGLWAAGWWVLCGAGLFPPTPQLLIAGLCPSGQCLQGLWPGCSENFIGTSIKMRAMAVLWAFRSRAALLEQAFQTQQAASISGESGFSAGSGLFPLCLIWQRRSLACFDLHLMFGLFVACWWRWWCRGLAIPPQPQGHKQSFVSGRSRWNGKCSGPSRAGGWGGMQSH